MVTYFNIEVQGKMSIKPIFRCIFPIGFDLLDNKATITWFIRNNNETNDRWPFVLLFSLKSVSK